MEVYDAISAAFALPLACETQLAHAAADGNAAGRVGCDEFDKSAALCIAHDGSRATQEFGRFHNGNKHANMMYAPVARMSMAYNPGCVAGSIFLEMLHDVSSPGLS